MPVVPTATLTVILRVIRLEGIMAAVMKTPKILVNFLRNPGMRRNIGNKKLVCAGCLENIGTIFESFVYKLH